MFKYHCLNPIAQVGLEGFTEDYVKTETIEEADGILVRSANMHDMPLPANLLAVARAGAGVNNIPLDKCAGKGIVVFNTPGANANGVKAVSYTHLDVYKRQGYGCFSFPAVLFVEILHILVYDKRDNPLPDRVPGRLTRRGRLIGRRD